MNGTMQKDLPEQRNVARILGVLEALSRASAQGLRFTDVVAATDLGKTTAHRLLAGLDGPGLVEQDAESGGSSSG